MQKLLNNYKISDNLSPLEAYDIYCAAKDNKSFIVWNKESYLNLMHQNGIWAFSSMPPYEGNLVAKYLYDTIDIILLEVKDDVRRMGIGLDLLGSLHSKAINKNANKLILVVAMSNFKALSLYE